LRQGVLQDSAKRLSEFIDICVKLKKQGMVHSEGDGEGKTHGEGKVGDESKIEEDDAEHEQEDMKEN